MKQIRLSDEVFKLIQREAVPFEDTPDTVLARLFNELHKFRSGVSESVDNISAAEKIKEVEYSFVRKTIQKKYISPRIQKVKPTSFDFKQKNYLVSSSIDVLRKVCELMATLHGDNISRLLEIRDRVPHFSRNWEEVDKAKASFKIGNSGIYGNGCLSSQQIRKMVYRVLEKFEYSQSSLTINTD